MSKTIEQQMEEFKKLCKRGVADNKLTGTANHQRLAIVVEKALQERDRIAREEERKECELKREYYFEFEVVDGINQHKDGLNFEEWKQALTPPLEDTN